MGVVGGGDRDRDVVRVKYGTLTHVVTADFRSTNITSAIEANHLETTINLEKGSGIDPK